MGDAVIMFQILTQNKQIFRMQLGILQQELSQLISFDIMQRHKPSINRQPLYFVFKNELGQIFKTKLIHFAIFEIDQFRNIRLPKILVWQYRMPYNLTQYGGSLKYIVFQFSQFFPQITQVLKSVLWVFMKELDYDLTHIITYNKVLKKIRNLVHIRIRRRLMQILIRNVLRYFESWSTTNQQLKDDSTNAVDITQLCDLLRLFALFDEQKFLNFISVFFNFTILFHYNCGQFICNFNLLGRNVIFISCPRVINA